MSRGIRQSWPTLLTLAVVVSMAFLSVGSFSAVQEAAKAELHLTDVTLGLLQGVSAAVLLVLLSPPAGAAVDRFNRMHLLSGMSLIWTIGTLGTAFAPNVVLLFLARMLASIGLAGALTAAISLASDLCAREERGRAMLILTLGKCGGQAMAFAITGALFGYFTAHAPSFAGLAPWRATHVLLAGITAACIVPVLLLREPTRNEISTADDRPAFRIILGGLWARRAFLIPLYVGGMGVAMADTAAAIWAAPVLGRAFHLTPDQFGGWMGALVLGTGILGAIAGGLIADWGLVRGRMLVGATIGAGFSIPSALFPIMPDVTSFALVLTVFLLSGFMCGVVLAAVLAVVLPNEMRGLGIGAFLALSGLVAFGMAPPMVGWVAEVLGGEGHLPAALALVGVAVSAVSLICFLAAARKSVYSPHAA